MKMVKYLCIAILWKMIYLALVMLEQKDEAQKYLQEAYYINRSRNKQRSSEIVKNFADEHGIAI